MKRIYIALLCLFLSTQAFPQFDLNKFNDFINSWSGKPYRFGGSTERGIDCSALMQKAYKFLFNTDIPRTAYYQFKSMNILPTDSVKTGDLVFFRSPLSPSGWHVGLYLWDGQFFHAANRKEGVKISSINDEYYRNKIKGIGRYNFVNNF
jgi:lipoprotein Spr